MRDTASDTGAFDAEIFGAEAIAADAVALAELPGGTGHEQVRIDWLQRRLAGKPGSRHKAVALGCCAGEDMHAPTERIRADSIAAGAGQLRAVLAAFLD